MGFPEDNRKPGTRRRLIAQIQLRDPYGRRDACYTTDPGPNPVLYLCDGPGGTHEAGNIEAFGLTYYPMIMDDWAIRTASGGYGEPAVDPDARIRLLDVRYPWQRVHQNATFAEPDITDVRLSQLFQDYLWDGSTITLFLLTAPHYTTTPGTFQKLAARILTYKIEGGIIELFLLPPKDYSRAAPTADDTGGIGPSIITRAAYPNAPDPAVGESIPVVFCGSQNVDQPFLPENTLLAINPQLLSNLAPMQITSGAYDPAGAGSVATIVANKHAAHGTSPYSFVSYVAIPELNTLGAIMDGIQTVNSRESYFQVAASPKVQMYINPVEIYSQTNVTNVERLFDGRATTSATLATNTSVVQMTCPSISTLGKITNVTAFCVLGSGTGVVGNCAKFGIYDTSGVPAYYGGGSPAIRILTQAEVQTASIYTASWLPQNSIDGAPVKNWQWFAPAGTNALPLVFRFENLLAGVTSRVVACGLLVEYVPMNLVKSVHEKKWRNVYDVRGARVRRVYD